MLSPQTTSVHGAGRDALLWSVTPILPVPLHGEPLKPLTGSGHRILVARDGLWLDLARPWLHLVTRFAYNGAVRIPVGNLEEKLHLPYRLPTALIREFCRRARASCNTEQAAFITFNSATKQFALRDLIVTESRSDHITYRCPRLPEGEELVVDLHSHARICAHFSGDDDADDGAMVKFSVVIGNCDQPQVTAVMRLCVLGIHIDLPLPYEVLQ